MGRHPRRVRRSVRRGSSAPARSAVALDGHEPGAGRVRSDFPNHHGTLLLLKIPSPERRRRGAFPGSSRIRVGGHRGVSMVPGSLNSTAVPQPATRRVARAAHSPRNVCGCRFACPRKVTPLAAGVYANDRSRLELGATGTRRFDLDANGTQRVELCVTARRFELCVTARRFELCVTTRRFELCVTTRRFELCVTTRRFELCVGARRAFGQFAWIMELRPARRFCLTRSAGLPGRACLPIS